MSNRVEMAGPSTLPGPLGQIDRIHYGTRINVFWYGETKNPKKSQNDLSIDLEGSGWYRAVVVNHPVTRTIGGCPVRIVVLVDLDQISSHPEHGVWVDALSDATYGDDFCGGKMWHFAQEYKIGSLDEYKKKCKPSDLNAYYIKEYLAVRNRAWEMFETFDEAFTAGSVAPLSFSAPTPIVLSSPLQPSAPTFHAPPQAPQAASTINNGTEQYEIELVATKIRQDLYKNGEAILKSRTRSCTVCTFEKRIEIKNGIMIPMCLLSDRAYFKEQEGVFRFYKTKKDPAIYNGFSVCSPCAASASSSGIKFLKIDETNKVCVVCLRTTRNGSTIMCKVCTDQVATNSSESIIMDNLFYVLPDIFPHYKIMLPSKTQGKFEVCEYKIDYHFDAQYYDGLTKTWKKIKFLFELDQDSHAGYDLWLEKTRLIKVLRGTLETHAKVVMLRLNHTAELTFPPGFFSADTDADKNVSREIRFLVLRHWVLYFLQNAADLPPATLLYLFYRYQTAYDAKYGRDRDQRAALNQEDDLTQDSGPTPAGQERLPPLWKHACTGFAFSSPPVRDSSSDINWRYYVTSSEYKDCNEGHAKVGPGQVGKLQAACEQAKYDPFPMGLRSDMPKFPSMLSLDEAFHLSGKKAKKAKKT